MNKINVTRVSNDINVCSPARLKSGIARRILMKFGISVVSLEIHKALNFMFTAAGNKNSSATA